MLSIDRLRQHNEKLRLVVEPHVGQEDWVYAISGWHPMPESRSAAVAETAGWALILLRTRQTELVYRARSVLNQLLLLQDAKGMIPRYLHDIGIKSCHVATYRFFLVIRAILQWHESSVGAALKHAIETWMEKILSQDDFQELLLQVKRPFASEKGVMNASLARSLFGAHVLGYSLETFQSPLSHLVGPAGLNWLQKPKGLMPDDFCWLDVWFELVLDKDHQDWPKPLSLCHLWTCLLHSEGMQWQNGLKTIQPQDHLLFRELPVAIERRGKNESCFLSMQEGKAFELRAFANHVQVEGSADDFQLVYNPEKGALSDEDNPWVKIRLKQEESAQMPVWTFENQVFSALKLVPNKPSQIRWKPTRKDPNLELSILSNVHGHLRQHPSIRKSGKREEQVLYFTPADFKHMGQIRIQIKKV